MAAPARSAWLDQLDGLSEGSSVDDQCGVPETTAALDTGAATESGCAAEARGTSFAELLEDLSADSASGGGSDGLGESPVEDLVPHGADDVPMAGGALVEWAPPESGTVVPELLRVSRTVANDVLDKAVLKVATHYIVDKVHIGTLGIEAFSVGVDEKLMRSLRLLSAAFCLEMERAGWRAIEQAIVAPQPGRQVKLWCYLDCYM